MKWDDLENLSTTIQIELNFPMVSGSPTTKSIAILYHVYSEIEIRWSKHAYLLRSYFTCWKFSHLDTKSTVFLHATSPIQLFKISVLLDHTRKNEIPRSMKCSQHLMNQVIYSRYTNSFHKTKNTSRSKVNVFFLSSFILWSSNFLSLRSPITFLWYAKLHELRLMRI